MKNAVVPPPVEHIEADYLIETAIDPEAAVEAMAGEQSSGTLPPFKKVRNDLTL